MGTRVVAVILALAFPAASPAGTIFLLDGRGWGHGVGMSQWGAEGYARHGDGYRKILAHYYSQTQVAIAEPRQVRVLLTQSQPTVRVGSAAPFLVVDARGRKLRLPARAVVVDRRFLLRHKRLAAPIRFEPGVQPLRLGGAGYRGALVVRRAQGGLMAVTCCRSTATCAGRPEGGAEGLARGDLRGAGGCGAVVHARDGAPS